MQSFPATQIRTLKTVKAPEVLRSINLFHANISYKIVHFNKEICKKYNITVWNGFMFM